MYPKKMEKLINAFNSLPGVGKKSAERYAFAVLEWDESILQEFKAAVNNIEKLKRCKICGNISENDTCEICSAKDRDKGIICVVSSPKSIQTIENLNIYNGTYHVTNGTINTAKGILPEDLNINELLDRINKDTKEIILALDPTIDGETTALYIQKLLPSELKITRLAQGIPSGSKLDYADPRTLSKAFNGRKN